MVIFEILFGSIALLSSVLAFYVSSLSARHLKEQTTAEAKKLLQLLNHYGEVRSLLEFTRLLSFVLFVLQIATHYSSLVAFVVLTCFVGTILYAGDIGPKKYYQKLLLSLLRIARKIMPVVKPVLSPFAHYFNIQYSKQQALYITKQDIFEVCEEENSLKSNLTEAEKTIIKNFFASTKLCVKDVMIQKRKVHTVSSEEKLTPVTLDELYKKEVSHFLVLEDQQPVGVLESRLLSTVRSGSVVSDVFKRDICFLNEAHSIEKIIDAFYTTKQYLYVVIDSNQVVKGIVTMTDVLKKILGEPPISDFDQYHDKDAVSKTKIFGK